MAKRAKETRKQLGKQAPCYRFFLNPSQTVRFTRCPACDRDMRQRKLPLMVRVEPAQVLSVNMPCRYCPHCDLLIVHQDLLEHFLLSYFEEREAEVTGKTYLIIGTLDRATWRRATRQPLKFEEMLEALHDFKEEVGFKVVEGWMRART